MKCNICNSNIPKINSFNLACSKCKYYLTIKNNKIHYLSFFDKLNQYNPSEFNFEFYYWNETRQYNNRNSCYINNKEFPKILPNIKDNFLEFKEFIMRIENILILS